MIVCTEIFASDQPRLVTPPHYLRRGQSSTPSKFHTFLLLLRPSLSSFHRSTLETCAFGAHEAYGNLGKPHLRYSLPMVLTGRQHFVLAVVKISRNLSPLPLNRSLPHLGNSSTGQNYSRLLDSAPVSLSRPTSSTDLVIKLRSYSLHGSHPTTFVAPYTILSFL